MKELKLVRATKKDSSMFARIKAEAYADDRQKTTLLPNETPKWYYGEFYVGLGKFNETEAIRLIEQMESYMILLADQPIGIVWLHKEEETSLTIEDFCILPEYQGNGYGTTVLTLIEELHPLNKQWLLTTPAFCKRNRHLYEKNGYVQIGTCSDATVIIYQKTLSQ